MENNSSIQSEVSAHVRRQSLRHAYALRRGRCELSFQFSFLAHSRVTDSFRRPLRRRALSTFLPLLVAVRARKP